MYRKKLSKKDLWKILERFLRTEPDLLRNATTICGCERIRNNAQARTIEFIRDELLEGKTVSLPGGGYEV